MGQKRAPLGLNQGDMVKKKIIMGRGNKGFINYPKSRDANYGPYLKI